MNNYETDIASELPDNISDSISKVTSFIEEGSLTNNRQEEIDPARLQLLKDALERVTMCNYSNLSTEKKEDTISEDYMGGTEDGTWKIHYERMLTNRNATVTELVLTEEPTIEKTPNSAIYIKHIVSPEYETYYIFFNQQYPDNPNLEELEDSYTHQTSHSNNIKGEQIQPELDVNSTVKTLSPKKPEVDQAQHGYDSALREANKLFEISQSSQDPLIRELYEKQAKDILFEALKIYHETEQISGMKDATRPTKLGPEKLN